jgi:hypothetical protein
VGDQQDGCAQLGGHAFKVVQDLPLHRDVKCRCGFVGDQQPGLAGQADGDQGPLAHAA